MTHPEWIATLRRRFDRRETLQMDEHWALFEANRKLLPHPISREPTTKAMMDEMAERLRGKPIGRA